MKVIFALTNNSQLDYYEKACYLAEELGYEILGFIDARTVEENFFTLSDYPVYSWKFIDKLNWEILVIGLNDDYAVNLMETFKQNFQDRLAVGALWFLKQKMIRKYEDFQDLVIQETLRYWKKNPLSVFNQHFENVPDTLDEILIDENNDLPYIWFETVEGKNKKMYLPKTIFNGLTEIDGKRYFKNILQEQVPISPHLYIKGDHKIDYGDVLIDCGVCEGNFALKYVDVCSKIYLFEPDPKWLEPLYMTFSDYADKVVLIPKFVSNVTEKNSVSIDDKVKISRQNVFLKMDIEGAEISALHGAKNLLNSNKVKASICSYHNSDDLWKIKSIFKSHDYRTWTSDGYMVFIWDKNIFDTADFRKGIVYAENY